MIFDLLGRKILEETNVIDHINLFDLQKGNYFLHIISNTGNHTERIIVK